MAVAEVVLIVFFVVLVTFGKNEKNKNKMKNMHLDLYFDRTMLCSNFHFVFHLQSILIIATNTIISTEMC